MKKLLCLLSVLCAFSGWAQESTLKQPVVTLRAPAVGTDSSTMIQGALNSLYRTNGVGQIIGGGKIVLGSGRYTFTNQLTIPQTYPFDLTIEGSGSGNTVIVDAINGATDGIVCADPTKANTLNIVMKGLRIERARFLDTNCDALVSISANEALFEDVIFTTEQSMHSNIYGSPLVWYVGVPTNKVGTIGLRLDGGANRHTIKYCRFFGLSNGGLLRGDHSLIKDSLFGNIAEYFVNGVDTPTVGSSWTAVTVADNSKALTNIFARGAGLIFYNNTYEAYVDHCQWFQCNICWVNANLAGNGPFLKLTDPFVESSVYRNVMAINSDGDDFGTTTMYFMQDVSTEGTTGDGFINLPSGAMSTTSPNAESALCKVLFAGRNDVSGASHVALTLDVNYGNGSTNLLTLNNKGNLVVSGNAGPANVTNFTAYAAGTAFTYAAGSGGDALVHLGTTDPTVTINQAGTYKITGSVGLKYVGATYAGAQTITNRFRRTNNSAADLTNGKRVIELPVLTTFTGGDVMTLPPTIYTAASGDIISIYGALSATPSVGSVTADSAEIVVERLY